MYIKAYINIAICNVVTPVISCALATQGMHAPKHLYQSASGALPRCCPHQMIKAELAGLQSAENSQHQNAR